jgi:hypothetical protein
MKDKLMIKTIITLLFAYSSLMAFSANVFDALSKKPLVNAMINDSLQGVKSDINGSFSIDSNESTFHVKAYGYKTFSFDANSSSKNFYIAPIKVKALYLTFWGASNNSKTFKNILKLIKETEANAIIMDVKNEYGHTSFLTGFKQANEYGAQKKRTNRGIHKFIALMRKNDIYTIARIVTFKDEIQASHNPDYAIKRDDNGSIWRNHDHMAWVDPYDTRSHKYTISLAEEAAKVGFDEINFDYIRFPAKSGLRFSKENNAKNRKKTIENFLQSAQNRLRKYGVFISVDTYGNVLWSKDDNNIGQTIESLSKYADYLAPMLYPSGFASGSFHFKYPADHPYDVIFRSIKHIENRIDLKRVRPWLQYFRDYNSKRRKYGKFEVQEQMRATEDLDTDAWMLWSPSSKYHKEYFLK